ncbi:MAG: O-antigen ligase family protein [Myxococcaceae bacterium]
MSRVIDTGAVALLITVSVAALVLTGSPLPTLGLLLAIAGLYLLSRTPTRVATLGLFALLLFSHSPQDKPADGLWTSPLELVGSALLTNLSTSVGAPLNLSPFDLLCALVFALWVLRDGGAVRNPVPVELRRALAFFGVAIVLFVALGMAQGGEFQKAYWQVRQLIYLPLLGLLAAMTLEGPGDLRAVGKLVVGSALAKAACGVWFHFVICKLRGLSPPYVTTHADTLHFVIAVTLIISAWLEHPGRRTTRSLLLALPLLYVIVLNDRRIAWIALMGGLFAVLVASPRLKAKRLVLRAGLVLAPVLLLYVAAGWGARSRVFAPVATLHSMVDAKQDSSTESREIENFNLAETLRAHPLGMGFGRPYIERVVGPDIASIFALYRYIPHNSVLWLLAVFGPLGFLTLLLPLSLGTYYAVRAHLGSADWRERVACACAIACVFGWLAQAFGDMGTESWTTVPLIVLALILPAKIFTAQSRETQPQPVLLGATT